MVWTLSFSKKNELNSVVQVVKLNMKGSKVNSFVVDVTDVECCLCVIVIQVEAEMSTAQ